MPDNTLTGPLGASVVSRNLKDELVDRILQACETGLYLPGDKLPAESELMGSLGLGRSTVREALQSLVSMGVITSRQGKGYFVKPSVRRVRIRELGKLLEREPRFLELMEARRLVEPRITGLAAERVTAEDAERLQATLGRLRADLESGATIQTGSVHLAIAAAAHNEVLELLVTVLIPLLPGSRGWKTVPPEEQIRMHEELVAAVISGDSRAAARAMEAHLAETERIFRANVGVGGGSGETRRETLPQTAGREGL